MIISQSSLRLRARLPGAAALLFLLLAGGAGTKDLFAQAAPQISAPVDEGRLVKLPGNTHPLANAQNDRGVVDSGKRMDRVLLVLKRPVAQEKALAAAIEAMHKPGSPSFHKWLTPEQIGAKYGAAPEDVAKVSSWLTSRGLSVSSVSRARSVIEFSGTAAAISSAFHTEIHSYAWQGQTYTANARDPQIPAALAPVVAGIASLNNFPQHPLHAEARAVQYDKQSRQWTFKAAAQNSVSASTDAASKAQPNLTVSSTPIGTVYPVAPADFTKIYNVQPLYNTGVDGTGQQIAIIGETEVVPADVDGFRAAFGLPAKKLNTIIDGTDPQFSAEGDYVESTIDLEWAGAIAKNATINFVIAASTESTAGTWLAASYAIDNEIAPILSLSYGQCESSIGNSGNLFFYQLWQQAAAEGITAIVASGDSGTATCDQSDEPYASGGQAVSGYASTPYTVSVGGTDFEVSRTNPGPYWNSSNDPNTLESALSYIPEVPWNGSCASPEVIDVFGPSYGASTPEALCNNSSAFPDYTKVIGGGGGASSCAYLDPQNPQKCLGGYPKPEWQQSIQGVPSDGVRDIPDISLFSSALTFNSGYLFCASLVEVPCDFTDPNSVTLSITGGTSFAAPAFAGIMALVEQQVGGSQGVANYNLYSLAGAEYGTLSAPNTAQTAACNASTVPSASNSCVFHDVTVGNSAQPCFPDSPQCVADNPNDGIGILPGYTSNPGYDLVTGLGSLDATNLVSQWIGANEPLSATTLSISPATSSYGQSLTLSGQVTAASGATTPGGEVLIDGLQQVQASTQLQSGSYSLQIVTLPAGSYSLRASYLGDGSVQKSTSSPVTAVISPADTTSALTFSSLDVVSGATISTGSQIPYGTMVAATLTVQGVTGVPGIAAPTGTVTFTAGQNPLGSGTLASGSATTETIAVPVGSYSLTATYSGDGNYKPGTPVTAPYSVVKANTTLAAHASSTVLSGDGSITLTAAITTEAHAAPPTGSVTFSVNGASVGSAAVIPGNDPLTHAGNGIATLNIQSSQLQSGSNVLTASYSGDGNFNASNSANFSITYGSGSIASNVQLTASGTTADTTTAVTLKAAVTNGGNPAAVGIVSFLDGTTVLGRVPVIGVSAGSSANIGSATLVTRLPSGTHTIKAVYGGAAGVISPAESSQVSITVSGQQPSVTSIAATPDATNPANYDLTATIFGGGTTTPTGNVTFTESSLNAVLGGTTISSAAPVVGLSAEATQKTGGQAEAVAVADFNGDGIPDLAATVQNATAAQLIIYLGNGDGTFAAGLGSTFVQNPNDPNATQPSAIVAGDFNADGNIDLAINSHFGKIVTVLLGKGDGTFAVDQTLSAVGPDGNSSLLSNMAVDDVNGDGILDLVVLNTSYLNTPYDSYSGMMVYFGNGDGTFTLAPSTTQLDYSTGFALADVNGDGKDDVVNIHPFDFPSTAGVSFGNGDGTFQAEVFYSDPTPGTVGAVAIADLDGDGYPDIAMSDQSYNLVFLLHNNGDGTFATHAATPTGSAPESIVVGDINQDGKPDLVVANLIDSTLSVLLGNGDGTFQPGQTLTTGSQPGQLVLSDLNNDGAPDVTFVDQGGGTVGNSLNGVTVTAALSNVALGGATTDAETVTASYAGDSTYRASTSVPITLNGSGLLPGFAFTPAQTSLTVTAGQSGSTQFTVTPQFGFTGDLTLACSGLPVGVTCSFAPAGVTLAGSPTQTTLTLSTVGPSPASTTAQNGTPTSLARPLVWGGGALAVGSALLLWPGRRRRRLYFVPLLLMGFALGVNIGCGGGGTPGTPPPPAPTPSTVTLASSAIKSASGSAVTLTAKISSSTATGTVTFNEGSAVLGQGTVQAGSAQIVLNSLPVGTHSITAQYGGDSQNAAASATAIQQVITGTATFQVTATSGSLTQTSAMTLELQ